MKKYLPYLAVLISLGFLSNQVVAKSEIKCEEPFPLSGLDFLKKADSQKDALFYSKGIKYRLVTHLSDLKKRYFPYSENYKKPIPLATQHGKFCSYDIEPKSGSKGIGMKFEISKE